METTEFVRKTASVMKGFEVAEKIILDDSHTHYLIMNHNVSDVFRMGKMVVLFKKYYSGGDYYREDQFGKLFRKSWVVSKVVVVTDSKCAGVVELFSSVDQIIILSQEELDDITLYSKSSLCVHKNIHRDEYGSFGDDGIGNNSLKNKLFGVQSYNWVLDIPMNFPEKDEWILSDMRLNASCVEKACSFFKKEKLCPDKMIIIFPYAKSKTMLAEQSWITFVDFLKKLGFVVFTNILSGEENVLPGTKELKVSIDILMAMGAAGCIMVGVRSSLIDVVRDFPYDIKSIQISSIYAEQNSLMKKDSMINGTIERNENTTYLSIYDSARETEALRKGIAHYRKGIWQKERYQEIKRKYQKIYSVSNFNDYIAQVVNMSHIMIFLTVCDSANKYWSLFDRSLLGLESDLAVEWRRSYVAVVDTDKGVVFEKLETSYRKVMYQSMFIDMNRRLEFEQIGFPNDNEYYVSSHAMGKGHYTKAAIVINGVQYALNQRGLNLVVFDREENCVIDSIYVDFWADRSLIVNR